MRRGQTLPPAVSAFDQRVDEYDRWYDDNEALYLAELAAVDAALDPLRPLGEGLEIGVGTGRFAARLGITFGVEPSPRMAQRARDRGVQVVVGYAEDLPFASTRFGYTALLTSLCFVENRMLALAEAQRVTVAGGGIVIGFLNRASEPGEALAAAREKDPFYSVARLFTAEELAPLVQSAGYLVEDLRQVIAQRNGVPLVRPGSDKGLYCVMRARIAEPNR